MMNDRAMKKVEIVRVLKADQRAILLKKVKSFKKCQVCRGELRFGFVFLAGGSKVANGITVECQHCEVASAWVFEPQDSLTLVRKVIDIGKETKLKTKG